jgi:hypothetical protein
MLRFKGAVTAKPDLAPDRFASLYLLYAAPTLHAAIPYAHQDYIAGLQKEACPHGRLVPGRGGGPVRLVRSLCRALEAGLMILNILYIVAAVGVAVYMLVALLGPETF